MRFQITHDFAHNPRARKWQSQGSNSTQIKMQLLYLVILVQFSFQVETCYTNVMITKELIRHFENVLLICPSGYALPTILGLMTGGRIFHFIYHC